jgi:CIC family chloride channel protein
MAFGIAAHDTLGGGIGPPALYAVVAMGAVFAAAAQAPLTAIASVLEMTGNFGLTLPIMLAAGISSALSKRLTYGSIYTTKLLRRGIDIERPRTGDALRTITVGEVMRPIAAPAIDSTANLQDRHLAQNGVITDATGKPLAVQAVYIDDTLEHAVRQMALHGHTALAVRSRRDGRLEGWIDTNDVLARLAHSLPAPTARSERAVIAEHPTANQAGGAHLTAHEHGPRPHSHLHADSPQTAAQPDDPASDRPGSPPS